MNDRTGGTALIDNESGEDRSAPSVMRYPLNAVIGWNPGREHARARFERSDESTHVEHNANRCEESAVNRL
ncbi:hypothetical protein KDX30_21420 [Pseudomonas sp. CDFA 553]|uniref:hypothetical protein n=1 Tax=Pseudomonas quasicaspiana TaxID=2829821 RepID=UPI001E657D4F|nr:hypothetical protein [Pseudomonas quasicaspiana]MCD5990450.1 hypothetical protein [Pseudomonas quasicaspiana]